MDLIQSVTPVRGRICVELDTGEKFWLLRNDAASLSLREGEEIDTEAFRQVVLRLQYPSALNKAVAMLARRACSRGEIEKKLKQTLYHAETIEMVLYKLEKEKLLNDQEFTEQWVQHRSHQKMGAGRIYRELRAKGISEEDARDALSNLDEEDQLEQAAALAQKVFLRSKPGEDRRKTMQRAIAALSRRGYSWDLAREACRKVMDELDEDDSDFDD